jgi:hypothetical protein
MKVAEPNGMPPQHDCDGDRIGATAATTQGELI